MPGRGLVWLLLVAAASWAAAGEVRDFHVDAVRGSDSAGDGTPALPWRSITHALAQTAAPPAAGDRIRIAPGIYDAGNGESFPLDLSAGVSLIGASSPEVWLLSAQPGAIAIRLASAPVPVTLAGLTVTSAGKAVTAADSPELRLVHVSAHGLAGGVGADRTPVVGRWSTFADSRSVGDGGGLRVQGTLVLDRCLVTNNEAAGDGGGVWCDGRAVVTGCRVLGNRAAGQAGGGLALLGPAEVRGTLVAFNRVSASSVALDRRDAAGGGLFVANAAVLYDSVFANNQYEGTLALVPEPAAVELVAGGGGVGIMARGGDVRVEACRIDGNHVAISRATAFPAALTKVYGGGLFAAGTTGDVYVVRCSLSGNDVTAGGQGQLRGWGGGLGTDSVTAVVRACTIRDNEAVEGGGVYVRTGAIEDCHVEGNRSPAGNGGGIRAGSSNVVVRANVVRANTAAGGGGIFGGLLLDGNSLRDNAAGVMGGGVLGPADLTNNVFVGNAAPLGGAVYLLGRTDIVAANNTLHANRSADGKGIVAIQVLGARLFNNAVSDSLDGVAFSTEVSATLAPSFLHNDLYRNPDGAYAPFGAAVVPSAQALNEQVEQVGETAGNFAADPRYRDAAGGNFAPLPGSGLIDAGIGRAGVPERDAYGAPRPVGTAVDVGAVEWGGVVPTPSPTVTPSPTPTRRPITALRLR